MQRSAPKQRRRQGTAPDGRRVLGRSAVFFMRWSNIGAVIKELEQTIADADAGNVVSNMTRGLNVLEKHPAIESPRQGTRSERRKRTQQEAVSITESRGREDG